jgi:hypothetical protein
MAVGPANEIENEKPSLRYPPQRQMSSIGYHQGRQDRVAENVLLLPRSKATFRHRAGRSALFPEKA